MRIVKGGASLVLALFISSILTASSSPLARPYAGVQQGGAAGGNSTNGAKLITTVEGITEYRLPNGLRVLLFPDQSKQTVTVNITYLVGSRHENYGETGMAHLLEHLMFKGSTNHANIYQELTAHGGQTNATTTSDRTNYYQTFPAGDANLEWALKLEADRMVNSFIARKDLDSEMTVVRNEYESGENSPGVVLRKRVLGAAFDWHNYSRDTIGARSDIENVSIDRLQAFYRNYYQPDNAVLLIIGRFDPQKTLPLIATSFGAIPRPGRVLQPIYTVEPVQDGERLVTLRRTGDTQIVMAGYHIPAGSHPDSAALAVLLQVLGSVPAGRLHQALVETKKAAGVGGYNLQRRDPGMTFLLAELRRGDSIEAARASLLQAIEEVATKPPVPDEVERARTLLLKSLELTMASSEGLGLLMSDWIAMGDWRLFFIHRDQIEKVTPADVQRVAAAYLKPNNRTVGLFVPTDKPDRAEIPPAIDVDALTKNYRGKLAVSEGEAFDPSPVNVEARVTRTDLPGGLKLALLPRKTRGNTVVAVLTLHFGDEQSLANRAVAGAIVPPMLVRGTARHTRQQIQDEFAKLGAQVFVSGDATAATISIQTVRENLAAVLTLAAEILREPSFPFGEFDQLKQGLLAGLEAQRSEPQTIAARAYIRHLNPYPASDVRYNATLEEGLARVKALTVEEVRKFHADFYGASNVEFAAVGDFASREIEKLTGDLFGSWKSPRPFSRLVSRYLDIPPISESFETPDKANAIFIAALRLNLGEDDADYPAMVLGNYLLGGGFLNSRLVTRIRQKEGLSYSVGSSLSANALDRNGEFSVSAIYAPQNAAKVEAAVKEEITRALKDGFTAEEVAAAKSGLLQAQQTNRSQDGALAGKLASYRFLKRTFAWDAFFEQKIAALTPDQIVAAMRRHLDPARLTVIKAGAFAKADKSRP
ncbi:MAG: pitrilysin family protein [Acidobacteriota bacterium]